MRTVLSPFVSTLVLGLASLTPAVAIAQEATPAVASVVPQEEVVRDLDTVVVSGVVPGPGLWKVSNGEHVLWVLGTLSPLPKRMEWEARGVEKVVSRAQEVMLAPSAEINADVGFFGGLALAPRLIGARRNPDGGRLEDIVPPPDYARWTVLKRRYLGRDGGIEKWRPMFAATKLYQEAVEDVGLRIDGVVSPVVEKLARRHGAILSKPSVEIMIGDPKQALAELRGARIDDLECFGRTLDRVENDLGTLRARANAWAVGDIEGLRALPFTESTACRDAFRSIQAVRQRAGDIKERMDAEWLGEAERALSGNRVTLALLPMRELLSDDGLASVLEARGYVVEAPGEYETGSDADASTAAASAGVE
jgi:hypothetical protein